MKRSTRYPQSMVREFVTYSMQLDGEQSVLSVSAEINRLLTAAVVNRRFCRLLLTNPLAALAVGYRGEAFRLHPTEVSRLSAIRATSLRDFALQLLMNGETAEDNEAVYSTVRQEATVFAL